MRLQKSACTSIEKQYQSGENLEMDLEQINSWFAIDKMTFNTSKCEIRPFGKTLPETHYNLCSGLAGGMAFNVYGKKLHSLWKTFRYQH